MICIIRFVEPVGAGHDVHISLLDHTIVKTRKGIFVVNNTHIPGMSRNKDYGVIVDLERSCGPHDFDESPVGGRKGEIIQGLSCYPAILLGCMQTGDGLTVMQFAGVTVQKDTVSGVIVFDDPDLVKALNYKFRLLEEFADHRRLRGFLRFQAATWKFP